MNLVWKRRKFKIPAFLFAILVFICFTWVQAKAVGENQVFMEPDEFQMGDKYCAEEQNNSDWCGDEVPHPVKLNRYAIDKFEVTNADYQKCFEAGVCGPPSLHEARHREFNRPKQPVVFVTWQDALNYCHWRGSRLPTEAEWERAAKGKFPGGAHFREPYNTGTPKPVGQFQANSNGLYDMMGNVYEWTLDWYGPYATDGVQINPQGSLAGKDKVVRGGSWNSPSHYLRASDRVAKSPEFRYSDVGFRCAASIE